MCGPFHPGGIIVMLLLAVLTQVSRKTGFAFCIFMLATDTKKVKKENQICMLSIEKYTSMTDSLVRVIAGRMVDKPST